MMINMKKILKIIKIFKNNNNKKSNKKINKKEQILSWLNIILLITVIIKLKIKAKTTNPENSILSKNCFAKIFYITKKINFKIKINKINNKMMKLKMKN